jgi:hypothetical protein
MKSLLVKSFLKSTVTEPPPPKKVGVSLLRSYWGILNETRMHKHTHKHTIP